MKAYSILGVDIGASGIKGAIVDVRKGELLSERHRLETPQPADPPKMAQTFGELVRHFDWSGPVGCGFPAIIKKGKAASAANISESWIGKNVAKTLSKAAGCPVSVLNDADAAGIGELRFGVGKNHPGVVMLITIGSGLGSALFVEGRLVPNTELGHLFLHNMVAEHYASNSTRKNYDLSWTVWGERFNEYLKHLERLFTPDLFILSGGVSKRYDLFKPFIKVKTPVKPAKLLNNAGIVGAACYAFEQEK